MSAPNNHHAIAVSFSIRVARHCLPLRFPILLFLSILLPKPAYASIVLPTILSNNAVLQRGVQTLLYGWSTSRVANTVAVDCSYMVPR